MRVLGHPKQITFIALSTAPGISPNKGWKQIRVREGFEMQLSRVYTTMKTVALNHSCLQYVKEGMNFWAQSISLTVGKK